jgi:hypothetical protein
LLEAAVGALEKDVPLIVLVPMSIMEVDALVPDKLAFRWGAMEVRWGAMEAETEVVWSVWVVL